MPTAEKSPRRRAGKRPTADHRLDEFEDFFENAAVALHWVGRDGTILRANRAELALTGYRAEEYVGRHIAEFHADPNAIDDILRRLLSGEELHEYEARIRCKDGSIRDVLISSNVLRHDGVFVHTRCITVDITARKRAELRLSEYLGAIPHHFAAYDRENRYLYVNPTASQVLGRTEDELIGRRIWDVFPEAEGNQYHREMSHVIETGSALASEHHYAPFDRWFMNYFSPTSEGVCVLALDITERRCAEEALRQSDAAKTALLAEREELLASEQAARDQAEEALATRDRFLSIAAHELRTPLTTIKGTAQLGIRALSTGRWDQVAAEAHLHSIADASNRLQQLLDDLLDVSRMRRDGLTIAKEASDIAALTLAVTRRYGNAPGSIHTFETRVPSALMLHADPGRLEQLLDNLLSNAVKYSPEPGIITVSLQRSGDSILLTVADSGIGLLPEQVEQVFEPFSRARTVAERAFPGVGLGLFICRQIVESHGGRIWAESAGEGRGSEFHAWLPLNVSAEPTPG